MHKVNLIKILPILFALGGCENGGLIIREKDLGVVCTSIFGDMGIPATPADMTTVKPAPCAAAKGLPGVPLICTDFPSAQTLTDLKAMGWDFTSKCPTGWIVSNSSLQVNNFSTFADTCIFTTRPLTASEYGPYGSFMLSVVQTVDLNPNPQKQTASIYLGSDVSSQQVTTTSGSNQRQRNITEFAKSALPNGGNNSYQPLFKITSTLAGGATGWQIESIAVMGNL